MIIIEELGEKVKATNKFIVGFTYGGKPVVVVSELSSEKEWVNTKIIYCEGVSSFNIEEVRADIKGIHHISNQFIANELNHYVNSSDEYKDFMDASNEHNSLLISPLDFKDFIKDDNKTHRDYIYANVFTDHYGKMKASNTKDGYQALLEFCGEIVRSELEELESGVYVSSIERVEDMYQDAFGALTKIINNSFISKANGTIKLNKKGVR